MLASFDDWKEMTNRRVAREDPDGSRPRWPSSLTAATRVFPSKDWTMAALKHGLKLGFKMGYNKALGLKLEDVSTICANTHHCLKQSDCFSASNNINADRLHDAGDDDDDDDLRILVVGKVDKQRQGAFIA